MRPSRISIQVERGPICLYHNPSVCAPSRILLRVMREGGRGEEDEVTLKRDRGIHSTFPTISLFYDRSGESMITLKTGSASQFSGRNEIDLNWYQSPKFWMRQREFWRFISLVKQISGIQSCLSALDARRFADFGKIVHIYRTASSNKCTARNACSIRMKTRVRRYKQVYI